MARKGRTRLTDEGIARLRPREMEYTVWDSRVRGLGVRVRPSGGKTYVLLRKTGSVFRRISLGPAMLRSVVEVRRDFEKPGAKEKPVRQVRPRRSVPVLRDFVASPWTEAHFNRYKPSTQKGVRFQLAAIAGPLREPDCRIDPPVRIRSTLAAAIEPTERRSVMPADGQPGTLGRLRNSITEADSRLTTCCDFPVDFYRGRPASYGSWPGAG